MNKMRLKIVIFELFLLGCFDGAFAQSPGDLADVWAKYREHL
jgi:hypothetical protein